MRRSDLLELIDWMPREVAGVRDVIAPFGFELLDGWDVGKTRPRRLYLYVQLDDGRERDRAAHAIGVWIGDRRRELAAALESPELSFVSVDDRRIVMQFGPAGGLACFVYFVDPGGQTLLGAYGEYIALLPAAVIAHELNEIRQFPVSSSSRRFVFQATRVLVGSHRAVISADQDQSLREAAQRNGSNRAAALTREVGAADELDLRVLRELVHPICAAAAAAMSGPPARMVHWHDFHSGRTRHFPVNGESVADVAARVAAAYLANGLESSESVA